MDSTYYQTIFKRKSFHTFRNTGSEILTEEDLNAIKEAYGRFEKLCPDIRTAIRIVPAEKVHFLLGAEYCILIYSEKKDNYLMNAGYVGEQLDLYLVSQNIGPLWYGLGKPDEKVCDGMEFVIMIAIRKISDESKYRKNMFKAKRKPLSETWDGDSLQIGEIARFAPSACNTQPWFVRNENGKLTVFRYRRPNFMLGTPIVHYNRMDIGIYLCFLEMCMSEKGIRFRRELFIDNEKENKEYTKVAEYDFSG